ncbi:hypothetical protein [Methylobacterium trifolii]|uniref:Uncharacterized protein n=1 Tax=Methylobacterium trifolii TaxID=1003092 RepID=A0ABQ4U8L9_9HYPH|nr:hypothetical protein [Methylobacterium trifolii]GJE62767.1 hypothetical protein MPOCJGCO_4903 [Methylobacterium trifolii]
MTDPELLIVAVDGLRDAGHTIESIGDDLMLWQVEGGTALTDDDLIALAIRMGLMDESGMAR